MWWGGGWWRRRCGRAGESDRSEVENPPQPAGGGSVCAGSAPASASTSAPASVPAPTPVPASTSAPASVANTAQGPAQAASETFGSPPRPGSGPDGSDLTLTPTAKAVCPSATGLGADACQPRIPDSTGRAAAAHQQRGRRRWVHELGGRGCPVRERDAGGPASSGLAGGEHSNDPPRRMRPDAWARAGGGGRGRGGGGGEGGRGRGSGCGCGCDGCESGCGCGCRCDGLGGDDDERRQ